MSYIKLPSSARRFSHVYGLSQVSPNINPKSSSPVLCRTKWSFLLKKMEHICLYMNKIHSHSFLETENGSRSQVYQQCQLSEVYSIEPSFLIHKTSPPKIDIPNSWYKFRAFNASCLLSPLKMLEPFSRPLTWLKSTPLSLKKSFYQQLPFYIHHYFPCFYFLSKTTNILKMYPTYV